MSAPLVPDVSAWRSSPTLAMHVALLAGPFLSMVDSNIVNVALPAIAGQLHAALATAQWVLSGYLLALAAALAASAYLAKRFGARRVYLASLIGFTLASAEIPDGNTLFNMTQRLGASVGIAQLATFFAVRERVRVDAARRAIGIPGVASGHSGLDTVGSHLPAPLRERLAQAAVAGFHDTMWLLVAVSSVGLGAALLLRGRARPEAVPSLAAD